MKNRLKDFMDEHREEFNSESPPDFIWDKIEDQLPEKKETPIRRLVLRYVKIAAAVIILFGLGVLTGGYFMNDDSMMSEEVLQEVNDLNQFYSKQVNARMNELNVLSDDDNVRADLDELETSFQALKEELGQEANDEQILEAMAKSYQTKLDILDRVLTKKRAKNTNLKSKKL